MKLVSDIRLNRESGQIEVRYVEVNPLRDDPYSYGGWEPLSQEEIEAVPEVHFFTGEGANVDPRKAPQPIVSYAPPPDSCVAALDNARSFKEELARVINSHSMENGSNTPDFILANFLGNVLNSFGVAARDRDYWHSNSVVSLKNRVAELEQELEKRKDFVNYKLLLDNICRDLGVKLVTEGKTYSDDEPTIADAIENLRKKANEYEQKADEWENRFEWFKATAPSTVSYEQLAARSRELEDEVRRLGGASRTSGGESPRRA